MRTYIVGLLLGAAVASQQVNKEAMRAEIADEF